MSKFNTDYMPVLEINTSNPIVTTATSSNDFWVTSSHLNYLVTFPPESVIKYLNMFSHDCIWHSWKPMRDDIWDELVCFGSTPAKIIFGVTGTNTVLKACIEIHVKGKYTTRYPFDVNDNSFGEFLFNLYTEDKIISPIIARVLNQAKATTINTTIKKEDKNIMKGLNFGDFGICDDTIRMSTYGVAVKNASGNWVSFDKENMSIMDVEVFNFEAEGFFFKVPIGLSQVKVGDVLVHAGKPVFVTAINEEARTLTVVDPVAGDVKDILPTKSPFGFNFITKIVSLFDGMNTGIMAPSADNPFGGMGTYMIMSSILNKDNHTKAADTMKSVLPFLLMNNMSDGTNTANIMNNPLALALILK